MAISLYLIFIVCIICSIFENRMDKRLKLYLYIAIGIILIFIAGMRDIHSTPDSESYEDMLIGKHEEITNLFIEPSFILISHTLRSLALGVNALFFTYAFISISLHLSALWKMSKLPFTTLGIYISFYYMMHELVQIRVGVAVGFFLWALYFYYTKRKIFSLIFILAGTFFHYSAITGLVIFLFSNKMRKWEKAIMYALIPIGFVVFLLNIDISYLVPDSLGGMRLESYRQLKEYGVDDDQTGYPLKYNVIIWSNLLAYLISLYYEEYLSTKVRYITIALKTQAVAFCCFFFLYGLSGVLATRLYGFFSIASIFIWSSFIYIFTPLYLGKIINTGITAVRFILSFWFFALSWYFMH